MYDTVPIRVRNSSLRRIRRLKAKKMLRSEKRVSNADIVEEALQLAESHESVESYREKQVDFMKYAGFIKGGPRTNAAIDVDEFLYGGETID